jgi:predicted DNA-binding transcriptional regulator AlpA
MVDPLWTIQDVGRFLGLGASSIRRKLKAGSEFFDPDFPKPFPVAQRELRWEPADVREWVLLQRVKLRATGRELPADDPAEKTSRAGRRREAQGETLDPGPDLPPSRRRDAK